MEEKIRLSDFDIVGLITLNDVAGIEKYVTRVDEQYGYLSRSKEYYNVKSMTELACQREELKDKLNEKCSKRNFVILENMLNCSGKVYFTKFQEYIRSGKSEKFKKQLEQAERCLVEDSKNIISLLSGKEELEINYNNILPSGSENCERRAIEMDNKAMLYIFSKALENQKKADNVEVLLPGYGSIYIGPFLKAMYNYNFTNIFKSKYVDEAITIDNINSINGLMSSERPFLPQKTIFLLDDNVGTGNTMLELKKKLIESGIEKRMIYSGAVQYNWRNYYRVSIGDKTDVDRFEINEFDFLTPINYAGHKLFKTAINNLIFSGEDYIKYLQVKHYRRAGEECDLLGAMYRGIYCANLVGVKLTEMTEEIPNRIIREEQGEILEEYKRIDNSIYNPISVRTINAITTLIKEIESEKEENYSHIDDIDKN